MIGRLVIPNTLLSSLLELPVKGNTMTLMYSLRSQRYFLLSDEEMNFSWSTGNVPS